MTRLWQLQLFGLMILSLSACGVISRGLASKSEMGLWKYELSSGPHSNAAVSVRFKIREVAQDRHYYGMSWNVWPDETYSDGGYEIGIRLRASDSAGYRVQLSTVYQDVALIQYPSGGYLQAVPYPLKADTTYEVEASIAGNRIQVFVNGEPLIDYVDASPIEGEGDFEIGSGHGAAVFFSEMAVRPLEKAGRAEKKKPHEASFRIRQWLGFRPWIFDGNEPILMLPTSGSTYINSVKLAPGQSPQLSWNSSWDTSNQGALQEGRTTQTETWSSGRGSSLTVGWTAEQIEKKYTIDTEVGVGFDSTEQVYRYDVEARLLMGSSDFPFIYGIDFDHHDALHPYFYQYLVVRAQDGSLLHQPFTAGPANMIFPPLMQDEGLRLWYGNVAHAYDFFPAVEYAITASMNPVTRTLRMAVCEAFFDTGAFFTPETLTAGTQVRVHYRYTGYSRQKARGIFESSLPAS